jgi:hypothetical protein
MPKQMWACRHCGETWGERGRASECEKLHRDVKLVTVKSAEFTARTPLPKRITVEFEPHGDQMTLARGIYVLEKALLHG